MNSIVRGIFLALVLLAGLATVAQAQEQCYHIICLDIYYPICAGTPDGSISQTFTNECQLELHNCIYDDNWVKLHDGSCA